MKNLKLNGLDIQKLDNVEMNKIQGGGIPIKLGDFSVIDTEFSNIRERFDAEMRKMEEEMSKFRNELVNGVNNLFK